MRGNKVKSFVAGAIVGAMMFSGIGYASSFVKSIQVTIQPVEFVLNDEKIVAENSLEFFNGSAYVPRSINYKGTVYVPVRFLSEAIGKEVDWDNQRKAVLIRDMLQGGNPVEGKHLEKGKDFQVIEDVKTAPVEIQKWVEEKHNQTFSGTKIVGGHLYILVVRDMPNPGYSLVVNQVTEAEQHLHINVGYAEPGPDEMWIMPVTSKYVLIQTKITNKEVVVHTPDSNELQ